MCDITEPKAVKTCSRCSFVGDEYLFILRRNICRKCAGNRVKEQKDKYVEYIKTAPETATKPCGSCNAEHHISRYLFNGNKCTDCRNDKRKEKYWTNEQHNANVKAAAAEYKRKRTETRQAERAVEHQKLIDAIGEGNAICKYCHVAKPVDRFRYNRLKCRGCERDDPHFRIIKRTRVRVLYALTKKTESIVIYLGCGGRQYMKWLQFSTPEYEPNANWHIDHVIPVSHFDLKTEQDQIIAFNWRNTMPLLAKDNLSKNNKIIPSQITEHLNKLEQFHTQNNIEFPDQFRVLFAKHLVAGSP